MSEDLGQPYGNPKTGGFSGVFARSFAIISGFATLIIIVLYLLATNLGIYFFSSDAAYLPDFLTAPKLPVVLEHDFGIKGKSDSVEFELTKKEIFPAIVPSLSPFRVDVYFPLVDQNHTWFASCTEKNSTCQVHSVFKFQIRNQLKEIQCEREIHYLPGATLHQQNSLTWLTAQLMVCELGVGSYTMSIDDNLNLENNSYFPARVQLSKATK